MDQPGYSPSERAPVVFVPGGVTPAAISYGPVLDVIRDQVQPVVKDLELYATDRPPANYGLEMEVEGIRRAADAAGFTAFHLVGYSGGAAISLAFTARYPDRLKSLALIEPAWIGNEDWTAEDAADWAELDAAMALPPEERMRAFMRWHMRPGVEPPRPPTLPGPPPPWMAQRPAGLEALSGAFKAYRLERERFRGFGQPVYHAVGGLSRAFFERNAATLGRYFPRQRVEVNEGRSPIDPPHRAEPERFARALRGLWAQGDARAQEGQH